jgi:hypothetical protein
LNPPFWFFSSEKNKSLLFLKKKKQKDFYFRRVVFSDMGLGRKVIANQHLQGLARGEQLRLFVFRRDRFSCLRGAGEPDFYQLASRSTHARPLLTRVREKGPGPKGWGRALGRP